MQMHISICINCHVLVSFPVTISLLLECTVIYVLFVYPFVVVVDDDVVVSYLFTLLLHTVIMFLVLLLLFIAAFGCGSGELVIKLFAIRNISFQTMDVDVTRSYMILTNGGYMISRIITIKWIMNHREPRSCVKLMTVASTFRMK